MGGTYWVGRGKKKITVVLSKTIAILKYLVKKENFFSFWEYFRSVIDGKGK